MYEFKQLQMHAIIGHVRTVFLLWMCCAVLSDIRMLIISMKHIKELHQAKK